MKLTPADLRNVVQHLPKDVRYRLTRNPSKLFVGGGFIRAIVAGEKPSDIDMFGDTKERLTKAAFDLANDRPGSKSHITGNAITLLSPERMPVQFITRWTFNHPMDLVASFDFTVCQAVVYYENGNWKSETGEHFYTDLAARRLVYTFPVREEEAGGSMLRAIKYIKRGYNIQIDSLAGVMARVTKAVHNDMNEQAVQIFLASEQTVARHTKELLREVDPLMVIDGLDVVDDHETDLEKDDVPTHLHPFSKSEDELF